MATAPVRRIRPAPAAKKTTVRPVTQEAGTATAVGQLSHRGDMRGSRARDVLLEDRRFEEGQQPAFVRVGAGLTINTGNFESLRIDVSVTLPCLPSELEDAYDRASNYAANFVAEEQANWLQK